MTTPETYTFCNFRNIFGTRNLNLSSPPQNCHEEKYGFRLKYRLRNLGADHNISVVQDNIVLYIRLLRTDNLNLSYGDAHFRALLRHI